LLSATPPRPLCRRSELVHDCKARLGCDVGEGVGRSQRGLDGATHSPVPRKCGWPLASPACVCFTETLDVRTERCWARFPGIGIMRHRHGTGRIPSPRSILDRAKIPLPEDGGASNVRFDLTPPYGAFLMPPVLPVVLINLFISGLVRSAIRQVLASASRISPRRCSGPRASSRVPNARVPP